jgi:hypothetical protein
MDRHRSRGGSTADSLTEVNALRLSHAGQPGAALAHFVDIVETLMQLKPSDLGERSIVTGDAGRCVEILKKCEDAGISEVILYFNFGGLGHIETLRASPRKIEREVSAAIAVVRAADAATPARKRV